MLKSLLSSFWLSLPARIRLWSVRLTNTKFTVTAAGIIFNDTGEVLLLKHRFRAGSGWGVPGGFLQAGEEPEEALRREMREEVNLELEQLRIFTVRTFRKQNQLEVVFVGRALNQIQIQSVEVEQADWFALDPLPEGLPKDQKKLIRAALSDGAKGRG